MMLFPGIAFIMQQIEFSGRNSFPGISMNLILRKGILKLFFVCHCISINTVFPVVVGVCFHRCIGVQHSPHTNSISAIVRNNYISLLSDLCACVHVNKNGVVKEAIVLQWAVRIASCDFEHGKKRWAGALLSEKCCCFVRKPSWKSHANLN